MKLKLPIINSQIIVTLKLWIIATRIMVTDTKISEISDVQFPECSCIKGDVSDVNLWLLVNKIRRYFPLVVKFRNLGYQ